MPADTSSIVNLENPDVMLLLNMFDKDQIKTDINSYYHSLQVDSFDLDAIANNPELYKLSQLYAYAQSKYPSYNIKVPQTILDYQVKVKNELLASVEQPIQPNIQGSDFFLGVKPHLVSAITTSSTTTTTEELKLNQPHKMLKATRLFATHTAVSSQIQLSSITPSADGALVPVHVATNRRNIKSDDGVPLDYFKYKTVPVLVEQEVQGCPDLKPSDDIDAGFTNDLNKFMENLQHSDGDTAIVFIHGFNTHFFNVVYYAAKARSIYGEMGDTFCFDWACTADSALSYLEMQKRITNKLYMDSLIEFLVKIMENKLYKKVIIVAHSMGNRLFFQSLIYKDWKIARHPSLSKVEITLFAANCGKVNVESKFTDNFVVQSGVFDDDLTGIPDSLGDYNLMIKNIYSKSDKALTMRELTSQKQLGRYEMEVKNVKGWVKNYQYTGKSWDSIGHSYVLERESWVKAELISSETKELLIFKDSLVDMAKEETDAALFSALKGLPTQTS